MTEIKHGGRRTGKKQGPSPRLLVSLGKADAKKLARLADKAKCSQAELLRRLLRAADG